MGETVDFLYVNRCTSLLMGLTVKIFLVFEQEDESADDGFWSQKGRKTELHG